MWKEIFFSRGLNSFIFTYWVMGSIGFLFKNI
nr:MAG TPA: hypothetical protein [Caudoviricetes sp.]